MCCCITSRLWVRCDDSDGQPCVHGSERGRHPRTRHNLRPVYGPIDQSIIHYMLSIPYGLNRVTAFSICTSIYVRLRTMEVMTVFVGVV